MTRNWWDDVIAEWESHPEWDGMYDRARGDFVLPGDSPRPKAKETIFIMEKYGQLQRALAARHDAQAGRTPAPPPGQKVPRSPPVRPTM